MGGKTCANFFWNGFNSGCSPASVINRLRTDKFALTICARISEDSFANNLDSSFGAVTKLSSVKRGGEKKGKKF